MAVEITSLAVRSQAAALGAYLSAVLLYCYAAVFYILWIPFLTRTIVGDQLFYDWYAAVMFTPTAVVKLPLTNRTAVRLARGGSSCFSGGLGCPQLSMTRMDNRQAINRGEGIVGLPIYIHNKCGNCYILAVFHAHRGEPWAQGCSESSRPSRWPG